MDIVNRVAESTAACLHLDGLGRNDVERVPNTVLHAEGRERASYGKLATKRHGLPGYAALADTREPGAPHGAPEVYPCCEPQAGKASQGENERRAEVPAS